MINLVVKDIILKFVLHSPFFNQRKKELIIANNFEFNIYSLKQISKFIIIKTNLSQKYLYA